MVQNVGHAISQDGLPSQSILQLEGTALLGQPLVEGGRLANNLATPRGG